MDGARVKPPLTDLNIAELSGSLFCIAPSRLGMDFVKLSIVRWLQTGKIFRINEARVTTYLAETHQPLQNREAVLFDCLVRIETQQSLLDSF